MPSFSESISPSYSTPINPLYPPFFTIESSLPNELSELSDKFSKYISIFGIHILGTTQVEESKFLHAASVLAEYLDDDQDGTVNDSDMVNHLVSNKTAMIITYDEDELESLLD